VGLLGSARKDGVVVAAAKDIDVKIALRNSKTAINLRDPVGFRIETEFLQYPRPRPRSHRRARRWVSQQRLQGRHQRIDIAWRRQHAGHSILDHEFSRPKPSLREVKA
jgi:hypothetical protein